MKKKVLKRNIKSKHLVSDMIYKIKLKKSQVDL